MNGGGATKKGVGRKAESVRYVALLRGVNVGGHRRLRMSETAKEFEALGFGDVRTVLASGNVCFSAREREPALLARTIEDQLQRAFDHEIGVIVRNEAQIARIVSQKPFQGIRVTPDVRLHVTFLSEAIKPTIKTPYKFANGALRILRITDGEVFSVLRVVTLPRAMAAMRFIDTEFGKKVTTRSWNTVRKIGAAMR